MKLTTPSTSLRGYRGTHWKSLAYTPLNVEEKYREWVNEPLFICGVNEEGSILWWRARKRGTHRYIQSVMNRVEGRIRAWYDKHKDLNYWKMVTLTIPETDIMSLDVFRKEWNVFLTKLRKRHPQMKLFRVYELQKRGSVHLHAIIWGIKWIPKNWLMENWSHGRPNVKKPYHLGGLIAYLNSYTKKSFLDTYTQAFMWFWGVRQWASTFPCSDLKTNSNKNSRIFLVGLCVVQDEQGLKDYYSGSLLSFLKRNGLYTGHIKYSYRYLEAEIGLTRSRQRRVVHGRNREIAAILAFIWKIILRDELQGIITKNQ